MPPWHVGADAEGDEADAEDEREEDEHPLRLAAEALEEEIFRAYVGALVAGRCSSRLRACDAAAISSCHSVPPFRYRGSTVDDRQE